MSKTTIYRCDLCGDESTKADGWRIFAEIARSTWMGGPHVYGCGDYCPACQERIDRAFDEAWEKVSGK